MSVTIRKIDKPTKPAKLKDAKPRLQSAKIWHEGANWYFSYLVGVDGQKGQRYRTETALESAEAALAELKKLAFFKH